MKTLLILMAVFIVLTGLAAWGGPREKNGEESIQDAYLALLMLVIAIIFGLAAGIVALVS